jgi:hypothetical protein
MVLMVVKCGGRVLTSRYRIEISGVPADFFVSTPIVVQAGHLPAPGCVYALPEAKAGTADFRIAKDSADGLQASFPVLLKVRKAAPPQTASAQ